MTGKGLKRVSGHGCGDHYINIKIVPPKILDEKQKALLQVTGLVLSIFTPTLRAFKFSPGGNLALLSFSQHLKPNAGPSWGSLKVSV